LVLTSNAPVGAGVQWLGPNGFTSNETNPVIYPALPGNAGQYTAFYFLNGCASDTSAATNISIQSTITSPLLLADISALCVDNPQPFSICIDELTLTDNAVYTWTLNGSIQLSGPSADSCIVVDGGLLQGGINTISAIASLQGCISENNAAIEITGDEFPVQLADAGIDMQYCPGEVIQLDARDPAPATGEWSGQSITVVFDDTSNPGTTIQSLPTGEYELVWTLSYATCTNYSTDTVLISIIPSPIILPDTVAVPFGQTVEFIVTANDTLNGIPFILEIVSGPDRGSALHAGNGIFRYTPDVGFVGIDMFIYRICSTDCPEECSEAIVILNVGNDDDCFTPTLFTPNDDGVNDLLIFPCLETSLFPENKLIVFNEWGDAVFTAEPYENDWDGSFSGEGLPVGTYFYIMDFGDGNEPKRSFLVLER
ncbi:MAG TPA: gliding motility-associated C-terminal domain-containing protein, partial [Saprospiraceae bacterium]|nr:gliding motility-associated C-terminal domain-containing protein [Saprospiraceae bacterium]